MSKLYIGIVLTVLLGGVALYVMGVVLGPAIVDAGDEQSVRIEEAFD